MEILKPEEAAQIFGGTGTRVQTDDAVAALDANPYG